MIKRKRKALLTSGLAGVFTALHSVPAFATGGSGDIVSNIDSWGNSFLSIILAVFKWGGIFSLISIAILLYFNQDENGAKKLKIGLAITIVALFIGWFARPIVNTFVK